MEYDLDTIPPPSAHHAPHVIFPRMLAFSLGIHVIFAIFIISGNGGQRGLPTINFIDLTMSESPSPAAQKAASQTPPAPPVPMAETRETQQEPEPQPAQPPSEAEQLTETLKNAVSSAAQQPEALQKASFGLGLMNGHFSTLADGRSLRDDMREYYLDMLRTINEKWWVDGGHFEGARGAIINIVVARNGEIVNARVIQSSGNPQYDRTVLKSLQAASPVPPLPEHFVGGYFTAPIRFNAPLNLLSAPTG